MFQGVLWGTIAASATLIGALAALYIPLSKRWIGIIMALGAGSLIGATSYELLEEALAISGFIQIAIGFFGGALVFTGIDLLIAKQGSKQGSSRDNRAKVSKKTKGSNHASEQGSGFRMFIGTVMDTLPESAMIGMSLAHGDKVSLALVVSIFISNFPEGFSSTTSLKEHKYSTRLIIILWLSVIFFSAISAAIGVWLTSAPDSIKAMLSAFAGGAIISMITTAMIPEAYKQGGRVVGIVTTIGLFLALLLHWIG